MSFVYIGKIKKKKIIGAKFLIFWGTFFLGIFSCQPVSYSVLIDRIAVVVNEDIITLVELKNMFPDIFRTEGSDNPAGIEGHGLTEVTTRVMNQLIDKKLIEQEIKRLKVEVKPAEVDGAIENFRRRNSLTSESLEQAVRHEGLTWEEYRKQMEQDVKRMKLIDQEVRSRVNIAEKDVKKYYEEHIDSFKVEKIHV